MTKRSTLIFSLTHGYPLWIVLHLVYGNWSRPSQLVFNVVPLIIFGGLFKIWQYSKTVLSRSEFTYINYLVFMLFTITGYYNICVLSSAKWVYSHNNQMAGFILLTIIFYIYTNYESR